MSTLEQRVQAALDRGIGPDTKDVIRDQMREIERLRAALIKIQGEQLRIASATDMTRPAMREAAMETHNEIAKLLANEQKSGT